MLRGPSFFLEPSGLRSAAGNEADLLEYWDKIEKWTCKHNAVVKKRELLMKERRREGEKERRREGEKERRKERRKSRGERLWHIYFLTGCLLTRVVHCKK